MSTATYYIYGKMGILAGILKRTFCAAQFFQSSFIHVPLTLQSTCTVTNETIHPDSTEQSVPRSTDHENNTRQKLRITKQHTNSKDGES